MLRFLGIQRLAVIEALEIEFEPGLNVLTGETGAGKSILVGAVGLLVGGRASADLVRTGSDTAVVQAVLDTPDGREIIARREVSATGRSRAFVDGELVTTAQLREAVGPLVDLHGQHEHQALLLPETHLDLLDRYGRLDALRASVSTGWDALASARKALDACLMDTRERAARIELLSFQINEIERIGPKPSEDEMLEGERRVLANADRLQRLASEAYLELYEGDSAILGRLALVWRRVADLASLDSRFTPYLDVRSEVGPRLDDLALFLRGYAASIESSPERLQAVEDRLAAIERLKRRHGPSLDDVLQRLAALRGEVALLTASAERAGELTRDVEAARDAYSSLAQRLSGERHDVARRFSADISARLGALAMDQARCEFRFDNAPLAEERWGRTGIDAGELYLAPNPGEDPRPLARIASGGELSRVTLAIKTLVSTDTPGKTLIFDEVDSGIGGRVADVVGGHLRKLGERYQVLCITHLPQVATHGQTHFHITKHVKEGRTVTQVNRLAAEERVREVARLIAGIEVTPQVLAGAEEMLVARGESKTNTKGESESASARQTVFRRDVRLSDELPRQRARRGPPRS